MKRLFSLLFVSALLLTVPGCGKAVQPDPENGSDLTLKLSEELNNERMEFSSLPWFSSLDDMLTAYGLELEDCAVKRVTYAEPQDDKEGIAKILCGLQVTVPVELDDLNASASMTLFYRYQYDQLPGGEVPETALTGVQLKTYFKDETDKTAYDEKVQELCAVLEEAQPEVYEQLFQQDEAVWRILGNSSFLEQDERFATVFSSTPSSTAGTGHLSGIVLSLSVESHDEAQNGVPDTIVDWY